MSCGASSSIGSPPLVWPPLTIPETPSRSLITWTRTAQAYAAKRAAYFDTVVVRFWLLGDGHGQRSRRANGVVRTDVAVSRVDRPCRARAEPVRLPPLRQARARAAPRPPGAARDVCRGARRHRVRDPDATPPRASGGGRAVARRHDRPGRRSEGSRMTRVGAAQARAPARRVTDRERTNGNHDQVRREGPRAHPRRKAAHRVGRPA